VNDLISASKDNNLANDLKRFLQIQFKVTLAGTPRYLLTMKIDLLKGSVTLSEESDIQMVLERFQMQDAKPSKTPIEEGIVDATSIDKTRTDKKQYQSMISSLLYLAIRTQLDISYSANVLSQFNADPATRHLKAVQLALRYLKGTITKKLIYKKVSGLKIVIDSDASYGNSADRRKSMWFIGK
jgi:hypothetical protein